MLDFYVFVYFKGILVSSKNTTITVGPIGFEILFNQKLNNDMSKLLPIQIKIGFCGFS